MVRYANKEKFNGNKPLIVYPNSYYPDKLYIKYNKFETPKAFSLYDALEGKPIELENRKIVFGIKAKEEEMVKYDFLDCPDGGSALVVHSRVLEKLNKLCPKDFQALPIIIKNFDPNAEEKFENKDFWLINVLSKRRIFDEKCIYYSPNGVPKMKRKVVMDNSMGDALLARDEILGLDTYLFFHPSLAKHFIKSKGVQFLTDEEASFGLTQIGSGE